MPQPDVGEGVQACNPGSVQCLGNAVRTCSADGLDFQIEACKTGETCSGGACLPIQSSCRGHQPFALSATRLSFDVTDDLKAQSRDLRLENCGATTMILRDATVRGPSRPDGTPVFELSSQPAQTSISPGGSVVLKVIYRPTRGLSNVSGKLVLSVVADDLVSVEIELRSKALCAAATPRLDFGIFDASSPQTASGMLQNCGTEPLRLDGVDAPDDVAVQIAAKLPHEMQPGEEVPYTATLTPAAPGPVDETLTFQIADPIPQLAQTTVFGLARVAGCTDISKPLWQLFVNNQLLSPWPGSLIHLKFAGDSPDIQSWFQLDSQPEASRERLLRVTDGWVLRPRVVGPYTGTLTVFDASTGQLACGTTFPIAFGVFPTHNLFVELTWTSVGDDIPDDLGFGHGANLDLHVLSTTDGKGAWNTQADDCFPGATSGCGAGDGTISVSESGAEPEFATFEKTDGLVFDVGVYLSNPFEFRGTNARIRVYRGTQLVADVSNDALQSANDFWLVGRWDETEQTWTDIDRVFSGFPR